MVFLIIPPLTHEPKTARLREGWAFFGPGVEARVAGVLEFGV